MGEIYKLLKKQKEKNKNIKNIYPHRKTKKEDKGDTSKSRHHVCPIFRELQGFQFVHERSIIRRERAARLIASKTLFQQRHRPWRGALNSETVIILDE